MSVSYYTITVPDTATVSDSSTLNLDYINSTHTCGSWCTHTVWTYPYYTYPQKIYLYQVHCPKCKKANWLELDTITSCTKCSSNLRAVLKAVDYEIEVDK